MTPEMGESSLLLPVTFLGTSHQPPKTSDLLFFIEAKLINQLPQELWDALEYFDMYKVAQFMMI
jgi:hypothetical protein